MLVFLDVDDTIGFMVFVVTSEVSVAIETAGTALAPGNSHDARPGAENQTTRGRVMSVNHYMRGVGVLSPGVGIAAGQMPRAANNGGTVPRGGANKSLTTDTPVGELRS